MNKHWFCLIIIIIMLWIITRKVFSEFCHYCTLYFTILIHGEVSNDDGCGVSWCDERHTRGGCIATGHWDWVSGSDANRAGVAILGFFLSFLRLCWWGSRSGRGMMLLKLLQLERSDLNHRVGVDFALRGGPGDSLWKVGVNDEGILPLPTWWGK